MLFTVLQLAFAEDPVEPAAVTTTTGPTTATTPLTTTTTPAAGAAAATTTTSTPTTTPAAGAATTTSTPTTTPAAGAATTTTGTTTGTGTTATPTGVTTGTTTGTTRATTTGATTTNTAATTTTTNPNAGMPPPEVVTNSDGSLSTIPATTVWVTLTVNGQLTTAMSLYSQRFSNLYSELAEPSSGSVGMGSFTGEVGEVRDYETIIVSDNVAAGGLVAVAGA